MRWQHLRRRCGVRSAFLIAIAVPFGTLLLGALVALLGAPTSEHDQKMLAGMFLSMGEVLGGVAGLLFAVLVFAVEFQIGRAGRLAPLTKFLHRSSGMIPDAAFVIGVIATSVLLAFWLANGLWGYGDVLEFFILVLFFSALAVTLWHFCRVIRDATGDLFAELRDAMLPYIDDIGDHEATSLLLFEAFGRLCAGNGIEIKRFGFWGSLLSRHQLVEFNHPDSGVFFDVRIQPFLTLVEFLRVQYPRLAAYFCLIPTDGTDLGPVLVLEPRQQADIASPVLESTAFISGASGTADDHSHPPSEADKARIQELLQQALIVRPRPHDPARDLGAAIEVLLDTCIEAAARGDARVLKRRLDVLESLVAEWSRSRGTSTAMFALAEDGPRFFPTTIGSALSPIVHAGIESGEEKVFDAVEAFLHHLVRIAESTADEGLASEAIKLLVAMYPITLDKHPERA